MENIPRNRTQDLREAFASIISMILGLLRAQGWRGLLHLPTLWLVSRELRRMGAEFLTLLDAFQAGTLPPAPPYPDPPYCEPAPAQPRHPSARSASPRQPRRASQPAPAKRARPRLAHTGSTRAYATAVPQDRRGPQAGILVTARST